MSKLSFSLVEISTDISVFGLSHESNDKTQAKDIPAVSQRYYAAVGKESGEVIPFFVISKGYNKISKDFRLFSAA